MPPLLGGVRVFCRDELAAHPKKAYIVKSPDIPQLLEDLQRIWEDEQLRRQALYAWVTPDIKAEYIEGEIVLHAPVRKKHHAASGAASMLLSAFVLRQGLGFVGIEKIMLRFRRNDYEPDVVYFGPDKAATLTDAQTLFPAPDLVVEVLSESTEHRDRGVKMQDYALDGVKEYWIIDPDTEILEQYLLNDGTYVLHPPAANGLLESKAVPGFCIPLRAIFDPTAQRDALNEIGKADRS